MSAPSAVATIERKKRGEALEPAEIQELLAGFVAGRVPDYQLAAWLMAVWFRGMSAGETLALTRAMVDSGVTLGWEGLDRPTVDKHSTGGVGDKTSIALVPLMAAAGAAFVKMSGRGLGHTGGTLDKLEAIPGFQVELDTDQMRAQVRRIGCALVGQSPDLVPADKALYALRDVTGTVDSVPLIASSVMSKKLAAGAESIVLDVKYGSGAFMQSREAARDLARAMVAIGNGAGRRTRAVLSPMEQPLGRTVGNGLEVREAIAIVNDGGPADLRELTLELGAHLMEMSGLEQDGSRARATLERLLASGAAAGVLEQLIEAQGGDPRVVADPDRLPSAPVVREVVATREGWVARADARAIAVAAMHLGAGRRVKTDPVDPAVGIVVSARQGDRLESGAPLATVHARSEADAEQAAQRIREAYELSEQKIERPAEAHETV
jgi:pyrimidine-nucleoside phosphorylase